MNFKESVNYLLSLGNEVETMKLGLENIRALLVALGEPQKNYLKVQVAGTNGKGSVCAFVDAICAEAGVKRGMFTSPHLVSITERIRINGDDISEDKFARYAGVVRETSERLLAKGVLEYLPTFFEQVTAIALIAFAAAKVELAILETGLGGRLDATTAAGAEIAAITRVDIDHQEFLGETIEEIAAEKAAIIQPGAKVVIGEQPKRVMQLLLDRCRDLNITPQAAGKMYVWQRDISSKRTAMAEFDVDPHSEFGVKPGLAGRHQIENACTAIMIASTLANDFNLEIISEEHIRRGVENARHPGRLEYQGKYLFDGAHNVGGAKALAAFIDEYADRRITLVFGLMNDKPIGEIADILFPKAENIVLTRPANSRALAAEDIATFAANLLRQRIYLTETVEEALATANEITGENGLILVTGSLYLIGEVKTVLKEKMEFEI